MTSPPATFRHWVIGDVHGCADVLQRLLDTLPPHDRLVLCGDVINRGPQIERTMDLVWDLVSSGRAVWLQGNHEAKLVDDLRQDSSEAQHSLLACDTYRQLGDQQCRQWIDRLASLPLVYRGDGWVATHAGFDPQTWEPCLNVRKAFWHSYDGRFGDVIVAHTPGNDVRRKGLGRIVLIDTGACDGGNLSAYCPETGLSRHVPGLPKGLNSMAPTPIDAGAPYPPAAQSPGPLVCHR